MQVFFKTSYYPVFPGLYDDLGKCPHTKPSPAILKQAAEKPWIRYITLLSPKRNKPESGSDCRDSVPENPAKRPDLVIFKISDI